MPYTPALPFHIHRSDDVIAGGEITSTSEQIHGLLRIEGEQLVVQWRLARETDRVGSEIRTDREVERVREAVLPLASLAGAAVRWRGWRWLWWSPEVVLTASDLRAFEEVAGAAGLKLDHPAILTLPIQRSDRLLAQEFAAELSLMLAEDAFERPPSSQRLPSAEGREPEAPADELDLPRAQLRPPDV